MKSAFSGSEFGGKGDGGGPTEFTAAGCHWKKKQTQKKRGRTRLAAFAPSN
jgi:hypothetical protein